ncbi:hypothetical protein QBC37DRAFT_401907 [Rhypophila decipiens]|uniref:Uncharacterized protein n=1 Tax=Rhypophila decipiens TaxID=261697 RepID=A0AAN6Y3N0_9PEZI|nr:hypothetical protein QBC37DRAFT_401907 [Rhypophila decipiens]
MSPMPEDQLRELIVEPDVTTTGTTEEARRMWQENFDKTVSPQFLEAQLKFYGEWFPYPIMPQVLLNTLRQAVGNGKCRQVADGIKELENELRRKYEPLYNKYQHSLREWEHAEALQTPGGNQEALSQTDVQPDNSAMEVDPALRAKDQPQEDGTSTPISKTTEEPKKPVVERYGFECYANGKLLSNGMGPLPEAELRDLIEAPDLSKATEEAQAAWKTRCDEVVTKEFLEAQLRFYGIWFPPIPFRQILLNLLRNGVEYGQCREIHSNTRKIAAELDKEYERSLARTKRA